MERNNKELNGFLALLLAVSTALCILLVYKLKKSNESRIDDKEIFENEMSSSRSLNQELKTMVMNNLHSESTSFNEDIEIFDLESGTSTTLMYLTQTGPILVFRFSQYACTVCVERDLLEIKKISSTIQIKNLVILASFDVVRELKIFKQDYGIEFPIYTTGSNSLPIPIENLSIPYYFIFDGYRATNIFYPIISSPKLSESYLTIIQRKYPALFD